MRLTVCVWVPLVLPPLTRQDRYRGMRTCGKLSCASALLHNQCVSPISHLPTPLCGLSTGFSPLRQPQRDAALSCGLPTGGLLGVLCTRCQRRSCGMLVERGVSRSLHQPCCRMMSMGVCEVDLEKRRSSRTRFGAAGASAKIRISPNDFLPQATQAQSFILQRIQYHTRNINAMLGRSLNPTPRSRYASQPIRKVNISSRSWVSFIRDRAHTCSEPLASSSTLVQSFELLLAFQFLTFVTLFLLQRRLVLLSGGSKGQFLLASHVIKASVHVV